MIDRLFPETPGPFRAAVPFVAAVLSVAIGLGFLIHLPYLSFEPGGATNVLDNISSSDRTYESDGELLLTTVLVSVGSLSVWDAVRAWSADDVSLTPSAGFRQGCETPEEERLNDLAQIADSKLQAELAAFHAMELPAPKLGGGRVLSVFKDSPSFGKLRARDLIVAVDGERTTNAREVSDALTKAMYDPEGERTGWGRRPGETVKVRVRRADGEAEYTIKTRRSGGCEPDRPVIGIALGEAYELPRDVDIDSDDIGGPSGGLVFALSIVDVFTPGDLTKGNIVAVTGEIGFRKPNAEGTLEFCEPSPSDPACEPYVGPVGGVEHKVGAAARAGARIFIAPASQAEEMQAVAPPGLRVVGVRTLDDALKVLGSLKAARSQE